MSDYIKLATAPRLEMNDPDCGTCRVTVTSDGDGYVCPVCGTSWSYSDSDGDAGCLYEDWAGEDLESEVVDEDDAREAGWQYESKERQRILTSLGITA